MKKMKKMVSLALTAAMTAGLMTGMGASRQRENKNHCVVKRNGIIRAVFDF